MPSSQWARDEEGDMLLPSNGQGADAIVTDPAQCAGIKIPSVLCMVLGEWVFDTTLGFPWPSIWSTKNPNLVTLDQLFRRTILAIDITPAVATVDDLGLDYDSVTRNFAYAAKATLANGQTVGA